MWNEMSNTAILAEIGKRVKEVRIRRNLKQEELAHRAGISRNVVNRLEAGEPITTLNLLRVLRTLDMLENLEALLPTQPISPNVMRKLIGKTKMRVRKKES